jgi:uncharacterized membrane protein
MREAHMHQQWQDRPGRQGLADGLGWLSIGLGLAELMAPDRVARAIGVPPTERSIALLRTMGVREIGAGLAILGTADKAPALWARVAGDALDIGLLGAGLTDPAADGRRGALATAGLAGVTMVDVVAARRASGQYGNAADRGRQRRLVHVSAVTTIRRPVADVYDFWRNFENFPRFMRHLESVQMLDGGRSRWRAKAPAGMTVEWAAEIVGERENESISWRSLPRADVQNRGAVRFRRAPGARGTEVRVDLEYVPPGGSLGRAIAKLFGEEPRQQIRDDLRRLKQLLETGEVPTAAAPTSSRPASDRSFSSGVRS